MMMAGRRDSPRRSAAAVPFRQMLFGDRRMVGDPFGCRFGSRR